MSEDFPPSPQYDQPPEPHMTGTLNLPGLLNSERGELQA